MRKNQHKRYKVTKIYSVYDDSKWEDVTLMLLVEDDNKHDPLKALGMSSKEYARRISDESRGYWFSVWFRYLWRIRWKNESCRNG